MLCAAPTHAALLFVALNLNVHYRQFEAAATTAASFQPFAKHTDVSFGQTAISLLPIPVCPLWSQCAYRHQVARPYSRFVERTLLSSFHSALNVRAILSVLRHTCSTKNLKTVCAVLIPRKTQLLLMLDHQQSFSWGFG